MNNLPLSINIVNLEINIFWTEIQESYNNFNKFIHYLRKACTIDLDLVYLLVVKISYFEGVNTNVRIIFSIFRF